MKLAGRRLIAAMCLGQVANLLPHVTLPAVMALHLIPAWGLTATQAGIMASGYLLGYMVAVPVLTTLTDRVDARSVLLGGSLASGAATVAFGLFADGLVSAFLLWGLAGLGFAGAYMPGLRALTDRLDSTDSSRAVTLFTGSFSLGVGLSFLASQVIADLWGWRAAFAITGAAPLIMVVVALLLDRRPPSPRKGKLLDFGSVLRNRPAMGYVLGYGVHCFELYGFRTWIVAFWAYIILLNDGDAIVGPIAVSVAVTLIALPASVMGNEAAIRFGRHRAISFVMVASAATALTIASGVSLPPMILLVLLTLYAFTLPADSGALTAGMLASADPAQRGATMAVHSMVGFALAAAGSFAVGIAVDLGGGPASMEGWRLAFGVMAAAIVLGPLLLAWSRRGSTAG